MEQTKKRGVHIFTRDLRVEDNKALYELSRRCSKLHGIFVFTPEQVIHNEFKSDRAVKFMVECLRDLNENMDNTLSVFEGDHVVTLETISKTIKLSCVSISEDYTPYARQRESKIKAWCDSHKIEFLIVTNHCLNAPTSLFTQSGAAYQIFSPYYNRARTLCDTNVIPRVKNVAFNTLPSVTDRLSFDALHKFYVDQSSSGEFYGTRKCALQRLAKLSKEHGEYETDRARIDTESTRLSPYLKFGLIGIRETYRHIMKHVTKPDALLRELHFRDFYMYIAHHNPHVFTTQFKKESAQKLKKIWKNKPSFIEAWKFGKTGVPLVDAAMREMNETGFMHNRGRMVVAMFLAKNLLIDWRIGEKYFAQQLIDYDPCSNNGGWQWSASTGADGAPYMRIMNPFTQLIKCDPQGVYTKRHVPELKNVPLKHIMKWDESHFESDADYPQPIVDVKKTRLDAIKLFSRALQT